MARQNTAALLLAAIMASTVVACTSTPTQQSTGQAIDDGVVTAKVKAKLIEDPMTKAHQINVETFKGTVQLSGFVESNEARSRALQLARDTDGVLRACSAVCPHLGCIVRWNDQASTWDCPCHGSRFMPDGKVLAGPAETPLEQVEILQTRGAGSVDGTTAP